jgi:hypothetical protein|tara:strand:+ start:986 stop:1390 length:405 start_codon:yes stop_codon:yes gene_type:complete
MNPILKNILAVIAGWIGGSIINMSLVKIGHMILPIEGLDPSDMNALAEVMPTLEPKYFIFPFLAHALGTLVGAFIAYNLAATHKMKFALGIGAIFFLLGIMVSFMIPAPTWFAITDILLAYIPMAWIGGKLAAK